VFLKILHHHIGIDFDESFVHKPVASLIIVKVYIAILPQQRPDRLVLRHVVLVRLDENHPKTGHCKVNRLQYFQLGTLHIQTENIKVRDVGTVLCQYIPQGLTLDGDSIFQVDGDIFPPVLTECIRRKFPHARDGATFDIMHGLVGIAHRGVDGNIEWTICL
jgi:hypothetical protein